MGGASLKELVQLFSSDTFSLSECPCDGVQCTCVCMWECILQARISTSMTQSRPLFSPLVDVVFQLLVELVLLDALFPLCKCLIPLKQFIFYICAYLYILWPLGRAKGGRCDCWSLCDDFPTFMEVFDIVSYSSSDILAVFLSLVLSQVKVEFWPL